MATGGNFRLRVLADKLTADNCTRRYIALQRSGQYSELRMIQKGRSDSYRIVGYKWPDKGTRRRLGIGNARKNPSAAAGITPNQVYFAARGKRRLGWIHKGTPTRYQIAYKTAAGGLAFVWRPKNLVTFAATDRPGPIPKKRNTCPRTANPRLSPAVKRAAKLSADFHGAPPRKLKYLDIEWPRALVRLGRCARVDYVSDKFDGKTRQYFHDFEGEASLFTAERPLPGGHSCLVIIGDFKIKPQGITG